MTQKQRPNPRQSILATILAHSAVLVNQFQPQEKGIKELAPGIIAVLDTDGEYCLFFDRDQIELDTDVLDDMFENVNPENVGLVCDVNAQNWEQIAYTAKVVLARKDGQDIIWHEEPIDLEL